MAQSAKEMQRKMEEMNRIMNKGFASWSTSSSSNVDITASLQLPPRTNREWLDIEVNRVLARAHA